MNYTETDPLDFDVARDWNPELVAASTSKLCRFTGRCKFFYSVAQHMQLTAQIAGRIINRRFEAEKKRHDEVSWYGTARERAIKHYRVRLMAHIHDSLEHKIGDIATPIKQLPDFNRIRQWEHAKLQEVYQHHGIEPTLLEMDIVSTADKYALSYEVMELMDWEHHRWLPHLTQFSVTMFDHIHIGRNTPEFDEISWLADYHELVRLLRTRETILV